MERPERDFGPKEYNFVATNSSLLAVQLVHSSFRIRPSYFTQGKKAKLDLDDQIMSCNYEEQSGIGNTIVHFVIKSHRGKVELYYFGAEFLVIYRVPDGSNRGAAEAFCSNVGRMASYPYFRAIAAHVSSLANAELPVLPVLSMPGRPQRPNPVIESETLAVPSPKQRPSAKRTQPVIGNDAGQRRKLVSEADKS
jgi:hypothetical protein